MLLNSKQELYEYLNNFDYASKRDSSLSSVYFLIKFNNHVEPIYFMPFEDVWFESPCELHRCEMKDEEVMDYVKEMYRKDAWDQAYEYESLLQKDGWHYDIDCPQCSPFLPDEIEIIDAISEHECMEWILEHAN